MFYPTGVVLDALYFLGPDLLMILFDLPVSAATLLSRVMCFDSS